MAILVFTKLQDPNAESAAHYSSRRLALVLIALMLAKWTNDKHSALQLSTEESWASIKERFRIRLSPQAVVIPTINPTGYHIPCFMTSYPPTHFESDGKRKQEELWMRATRF